jgi:hypothetical protein
MKSFQKLLRVANTFEKKAQDINSQIAGQVPSVLRRANLWNLSSTVAPLLGRAGAPDRTVASVNIVVNPGPQVTFSSTLNPSYEQTGQKFDTLLTQKLGHLFNQALQAANINPTSPITISWLRVTELKQS